MFNARDLILFLAGAEFFHTLSHVLLGLVLELPLDLKFMVLTPGLNTWALIGNGVLTVLLLFWAYRLGKK